MMEWIQFELFLVALDCFFWGGAMGYDHILWRKGGLLSVR